MNDFAPHSRPVLEHAAQVFINTHARLPFTPDATPVEVTAGQQRTPTSEDTDTWACWINVPCGPTGQVRVRIVRPAESVGELPVILYLHGLGWALGDAETHQRLVCDLALGADAAVVCPEYDQAPKVRYPTSIEQCYAVARWIRECGPALGLDGRRLALVGDSVGANLAAALTLLAKVRDDVKFLYQVLFCPVTDASFDTPSYHEFAHGYFLDRDMMRWFWDQYTADADQRAEITASPLRATLDQLAQLPPALIITGEADVLRDEGEAYAAKLRAAGVPVVSVRYHGTIHDFMLFHALRNTQASRAALIQAVDTLHVALHS